MTAPKESNPNTVFKLYALITQFQNTVGDEQVAVQKEINELLNGYTAEQISVLREQVMEFASEVISGNTVIMTREKDEGHSLTHATPHKQSREQFIKQRAAELASNLPKDKLMKVVRAYHAPEQREISFFGPDYNPKEPATVFFSFRDAVYALRYESMDDRRMGGSPYRLDHVSGELHQEKRRKTRVIDSLELSLA